MTALRWRMLGGMILAIGGLAPPVLAQFCAIDPISPLCCPSPCPVVDSSRIPTLLEDVDILGKGLGVDAQIVQSASQIGQSVGDAKAVAGVVSKQFSTFSGVLSNELTAIQTGLPTNPTQALTSLKQTLFEAAPASSSASQSFSRLSARSAAAQGEQVAALATSLMRVQALPALSQRGSQLAATALGAQQVQGDMAANATSRLLVSQDVGALHQLVSAWVAQRAMQAALVHPGISGDTPVSAVSATPAPIVSSGTSSLQNPAAALDQLVALHDARAVAQTVVSAYPALQQTVGRATLANQFAGDAESALQRSLSDIGLSGSAILSGIENALRAADASGWLDGGKTVLAQAAVSNVTAMLAKSGKLSLVGGTAAPGQLQGAMADWLDADKQSRYWAGLAAQAQQSISVLDANLGALSDRAGVDVTGASGAAREKILLAKLSGDPAAARWRPLLTAAAKDASARSVLSYSVMP